MYSYEHVVAGFVRNVTKIDPKRSPPQARYLMRYCVNRWISVHDDTQQMLTVMHVLIPKTRLLEYTERLVTMFQNWLPSEFQCLTAEHSLDALLDQTLFESQSSYFIVTLDFADDTGRQLSFGQAVKKHNQSVILHHPDIPSTQLTWKVSGRAHADADTLKEMEQPIVQSASTHTPATLTSRATPVSQSAAVAGTSRDIVAVTFPTAAAGTSQDTVTSQHTPMTETNSISRDSDSYSCPVCFGTVHLCLFECGHVMCKQCIEFSKTLTDEQQCSLCRKRWNTYRVIYVDSISKKICSRCKKEKQYFMLCGHATCACPRPVCRRCHGSDDVIRIFAT